MESLCSNKTSSRKSPDNILKVFKICIDTKLDASNISREDEATFHLQSIFLVKTVCIGSNLQYAKQVDQHQSRLSSNHRNYVIFEL